MNQDLDRSSRPLFYAALTAAVLCTLGLQTARGAAADREGPVSRRVVAAAMPNHAAELSSCFEEARAGDPDLEVRMKVAWLIKQDGTVTDVAVPEANTYNPVLETCVKNVVAQFSFYPSQTPVLVNAPLVFRADGLSG